MNEQNILIPIDYIEDFLGIVSIDILHDSKGHGYLSGQKLSKLSDLLAYSVYTHNHQLDFSQLSDYFFITILSFFKKMWANNLKALNYPLDDTNYTIGDLKQTVKLPIRSVAERDTEDTFENMGNNVYTPEVQNYIDQRYKLDKPFIQFISPQNVYTSNDYFNQGISIINKIKGFNEKGKIILDMKASAGLIRTITDPIGYITGLPTFADPGYNMPGMSAIRQHSEIAFIPQNLPNSYISSQTFNYTVTLELPLGKVTFLKVEYYYGTFKEGLDRENMSIKILDDYFQGFLPRSGMMAESLNNYFNPKAKMHTKTVTELFGILNNTISSYYKQLNNECSLITTVNGGFTELHLNKKLSKTYIKKLLQFTNYNYKYFKRWFKKLTVDSFEGINISSYILNTIKLLNIYNLYDDIADDPELILPINMIKTTLPLLLSYYNNTNNIKYLAYCYHQLNLLYEYISNTHNLELSTMLLEQYSFNLRSKLTVHITTLITKWYNNFNQQLSLYSKEITSYLDNLILNLKSNMRVLLKIDDLEDVEDSTVINYLSQLPLFNPSDKLNTLLIEYLYYSNPDLYIKTLNVNRTGLLMITMLSVKSIKDYYSNQEITQYITENIESIKMDALRHVLGKFSGDFGQIVWAIHSNNIFATEDNNTSAMALFMHRLPTINSKWGNIHGLGDGSCVEIFF
jgi:hypothetical protein